MDLRVIASVLSQHQASTIPLPTSFPKSEIGLMTQEEFLKFRNPGGKHHPRDAYDFALTDLNREYPDELGSVGDHSSDRLSLEKLNSGYRFVNKEDGVVAIIHQGVLYYDNPRWKSKFPRNVIDHRGESVPVEFKSMRQVKYLSEKASLISPLAKMNKSKYPVILQHLKVKGETVTVQAEATPVKDKGVTLAILNSEGLVVASASNEWGATLVTVAREYRGRGLGKIIGRYWYEYNPSFPSGGFTQSGEENALALWRERVHEFSSRGWYSELVRSKQLTYQRVKDILKGSGLKAPVRKQLEPDSVKATGDILVFCQDDVGFVVYDRAFFEEQDEKFIHGYGFFRSSRVGVFLFRIDYDRPFADLTTKVALQMARDNGDDIYNGEGYHDLMELEGIPGVVQEGDYVKVTRDILPLKAMCQHEKSLRKKVDPYQEIYHSLLEIAEAKWS